MNPERVFGRASEDRERTRYGPHELRGERQEQFVHVPGVFLAAPPRDLPVETRTVSEWGRRRIEEWTQDGKPYARWRWATEAECEAALRDEETRRLTP